MEWYSEDWEECAMCGEMFEIADWDEILCDYCRRQMEKD